MSVVCGEPEIETRLAGGWRRLWTDIFTVGAATIVCQALGVVTSLALRAALSPAQMGLWQGLKLPLAYSNYASLGVSKGASREVSLALGRGDERAARHAADAAFTFNTLTSLGFALLLGLAGVALSAARGWDSPWTVGLAAIGLIAVLQRQLAFLTTLLRARQDFHRTAQLGIVEAALALVFGVAGATLFGVAGLLLATAVSMLACLAWLHAASGIRLAWTCDRREIARLASIGLPILGLGIATTLARSIDRWMILACAADCEEQLGYYSLSLLVTTQIAGIASMLSIVVGPRISAEFGRSSDPRYVGRLTVRMTELNAIVMAAVGLATVILGPTVFELLLPRYADGIAPLLLRVPGAVAIALTTPATQCLIAIDRGRAALWLIAPPLVLAAGGCWLALDWGLGIEGVALATTASEFLYLALVAGAVAAHCSNAREQARYVVGLTAATLPLLALALELVP